MLSFGLWYLAGGPCQGKYRNSGRLVVVDIPWGDPASLSALACLVSWNFRIWPGEISKGETLHAVLGAVEGPKPKRKAIFKFSGSSLIGRGQNPKIEFLGNATLKSFDGTTSYKVHQPSFSSSLRNGLYVHYIYPGKCYVCPGQNGEMRLRCEVPRTEGEREWENVLISSQQEKN